MKNIFKRNYTALLILNDESEIQKITSSLFFEENNFHFTVLNSAKQIDKNIENQNFDLIIYNFNETCLNPKLLKNSLLINICDISKPDSNNHFDIKNSSYFKIHKIIKDNENKYLQTIKTLVIDYLFNAGKLQTNTLLSYATRSSRDSIYITDMQGTILYINPSFSKTYQYSENEILGLSSEILFKKALTEKDIENVLVHSSEEGWTGESIAIKKDGSEFPISFSISYVQNEKNEIIGLVVVVRDNTKLKTLENKIKENEERYRQIFEKNLVIKLLIDPETGLIIDANSAASNFYGYSSEKLKKMNIAQINMFTSEEIMENLQIAANEKTKNFFFKHRLASGEIKDVEVYSSPIILDNKKYLYSIITDITDKLKQNKILKETEAKYETIFENTGTAMLILDSELTIILANKEFESLSGYTKSELESQKKFLDFIAIDDIEKIKEYSNLALINNMAAPGSYKLQFIDINNNIKEILLKITLIANTNERIASLQDISESEKQKKELIFNESRLESLLKLTKMEDSSTSELLKFALEQAINLTRSRFGYIASVNEKENTLYVEAISKMTEERFKISHTNLTLNISENGILNDVIKNKCHLLLNSPGRMIVKNSNFSKLHSWFNRQIILPVIDSQQAVMMVCIANKWDEYDHSDVRQLHLLMEETWRILKQKKAESAIKEANLKLMELDKLKNAFLSNVSHELRTPLTSIGGFSKIIKKKLNEVIIPAYTGLDPKVNKNFKQINDNILIIVEECERLTHLVNQILDIQKIESDNFTYKFDIINVVECINKAIMTTNSLCESKKITLATEIKRDLITVTGDMERLIQVIINLISNAVKFTPENGIITVFVDSSETDAIIKIKDSGIGLKTEDLDMIFERFKQADNNPNTGGKNSGTGLGLTICRQIIDKHGGRIWAESEPGTGSTFSFTIPII